MSTVKERGASQRLGYVLWLEGFTKICREATEVSRLVSLGKGRDMCHPPQPVAQATDFPAPWCGDTWPQPTPLPQTVGSRKLGSAVRCRFPSPRALDHGGSCWECVLINKEYLSNHCHVSILALLSNHRKTTQRRGLQVARGLWREAECNFHSLNRTHVRFKAPPGHTEMLKSKMFTN